jgi:hypothetical protein
MGSILKTGGKQRRWLELGSRSFRVARTFERFLIRTRAWFGAPERSSLVMRIKAEP